MLFPTTSSKRVLVTDDNQDSADALQEVLTIYGYAAVTAYDGQQALDCAELFNPDLVILDIDMPVMNGYEAARRLRKRPRDGRPLVLVALTARDSDDDKQMALAAGFDVHLRKPLAMFKLTSLIEQLL